MNAEASSQESLTLLKATFLVFFNGFERNSIKLKMSGSQTKYPQQWLPKLRSDVVSFFQPPYLMWNKPDIKPARQYYQYNCDKHPSPDQQAQCYHTSRTGWTKHRLGQTLSQPGTWQQECLQYQCFHLRTPSHPGQEGKHPLQQSISLPAFSRRAVSNLQEHEKRNVNFLNRPLPPTPGLEKRGFTKGKSIEGTKRKKEPLMRKTFYESLSLRTKFQEKLKPISFDDNIEDHIYEEINEDHEEGYESEEDAEDNQFINLISSERRRNLRFYGCTGWDFGTEII